VTLVLTQIAAGEATRRILRAIAAWEPGEREEVVRWAASEIGADAVAASELAGALSSET
jgi:hypothetical protein